MFVISENGTHKKTRWSHNAKPESQTPHTHEPTKSRRAQHEGIQNILGIAGRRILTGESSWVEGSRPTAENRKLNFSLGVKYTAGCGEERRSGHISPPRLCARATSERPLCTEQGAAKLVCRIIWPHRTL